ncbi:MSHA pilin protein MshD [Paucimonas lemoignei]|uniref:MSHA pilin protein MshD n=1 Tax=Paucimonas lemoignei TaxID=29443 RepID=A0A4R3I073_PAULE|nr:prepilin-type N-terminal cleavage/methylation domain-containing protein [Paucimonas lemoignei]TCS39076.1 MSHA pilin protein MshD [Paucimonas lemoignei]
MSIARTRHSLTGRRQRQHGLSLIELIVFIMIVSVAVAGVLAVLNQNTRASADPLRRKQALAIAEALLEEVELARFTYCDPADAKAQTATSPADCASIPENAGPESGNARPYDNVNDYVAAFGSAQAYSTDVADGAFPSGYATTVTIQADSNLGPTGAKIPSGGAPANMNALRITVRVNYSATDAIILEGYRTRYAPEVTP